MEDRLTRRFRWLTIAFVAAVIAIFVLELALQTAYARRLYAQARLRLHPFLQIVPSASGDGSPAGPDHINTYRFRGDDIAIPRQPKSFRIFTLGGSTTLGVRNTYIESYPFKLEQALQARYPAVKIEVQNAGGDWYSTAHMLINYQLRVRRFRPDLVIAFEAVNDLCRSFSPPWFSHVPFQPDYSHYLGPQARFLGPEMEFSSSADRFLDPLTVRLARRLIAREPSPYRWGAEDLRRLAATMQPRRIERFPSLQSFHDFHELLIRSARADGVAIALASQPFVYRSDMTDQASLLFPTVFCSDGRQYPSLDSMVGGMRLFNAEARRVAEANGAGFIDFEAAVPKAWEFFADDVHLKGGGNELVARAAIEWIVTHRLVESSPYAGGQR